MKIAVVGCGWLGLPLASSLVQKSFEVHGTSRDEEKVLFLKEKGIVSHLLSSKNFNSIDWLNKVDVLVLNIPPSDFKSIYGEKMLEISNNLKENSKIIFISSTSVYKNNDSIVDESSDAKGGARNGKNVLEAEQMLQKKWRNNLTIVRMSGLVGGNRHPAKYMAGKHYKNGDNPVNLIHLEDCCGIIESVIDQGFWGKIVNGVCEENPSKNEYYTFSAKKLGVEPPVFSDGSGDFKKIDSIILGNELNYDLKYKSPYDFPL